MRVVAAIEVAAPEIDPPHLGTDDDWKHQLARLARELFRAGLRHPSIARGRFGVH